MSVSYKHLAAILRTTRGFTLAEMAIALGIFAIIMGMTAGLILNSYAADQKTRVSQVVFDETRIAMERIAKEIRRGTVDYEEYYNWSACTTSCSLAGTGSSDTHYGKNYGYYGLQFYREPGTTTVPNFPVSTTDKQAFRKKENAGKNAGAAALGDATSIASGRCTVGTTIPQAVANTHYEQCELYLISSDGTEKTIIRTNPVVVSGVTEYHLSMLKMAGTDTDGDGQIDTWTPEADYGTAGVPAFVAIQPDSITITGLKFIIAPLDDPRKAFADYSNATQIQPEVTIVMTAEPSVTSRSGIRGALPTLTLQTTIAARAQNEVTSIH